MNKGTARRFMVLAAAVVALSAIVLAQDAGKFTDKRDGKTYKKVTIGEQVWMAENLAYNATGSVCYDNKESNCVQYGRLYTWSAAKTACPAGWHLPSDAEWDVLMVSVGGVKGDDDYWEGAGKKLKSTSGWYNNGNGTNAHGFSALPGGYGYSGGYFSNAGNLGYWWSVTEDDASNAWHRDMSYGSEYVGRDGLNKTTLCSVRCVQD